MPALPEACRRFADNCEEQARRPSCTAYSRGRYHAAAREAREALTMRLCETGLQIALDSAMSTARFAAFINGDEHDAPTLPASHPPPRDRAAAAGELPRFKPATALPPCDLAKRHGMTARGARKRIMNAHDRGAAGAYRIGERWFAEPDAFAQKFRMSSV